MRYLKNILLLNIFSLNGHPAIAQMVLLGHWSPLEMGLKEIVHSIFVDAKDVYVTGDFTPAGGKANYIAGWDAKRSSGE